MAEANYRKEHQFRQQHHHTNIVWFALITGFFAGLIWGGIRWIAYALHFTIVVPGFLIEPFFKHDFLTKVAGGFAGWGSFLLLSIIATFIYALLFRKIPGPWAGLIYGIVWWVLLFVLLGPLWKMMPPITKVNWNSIWTDGCLFLLWGMFIGYTIATEYNDERLREPDDVESDEGGQQGEEHKLDKERELEETGNRSEPELA